MTINSGANITVALLLVPLYQCVDSKNEPLDYLVYLFCFMVQAHAESTIGAWQLCLEMMGIVACLTNLLLAVVVSKNVDMYVPKSMTDQLGTIEGKV